MHLFYSFRRNIYELIFLVALLPSYGNAETITWTGYGGDSNWSNPLNWSGQHLPQATDDVLLDNGDMPVSYQVLLPDVAVVLKTVLIRPSPGRNIELILPASNIVADAFSVTGPGYGIDLNAGAIFRNASGLTSGESLQIADSIIIRDGARYIHQTRASHANNILKFLSIAPGTEEGIFDFDVPKAAYTISVSNRNYGSLELHSDAYGSSVSYTGTGANPLLIRGNLRVGTDVHLNIDLSGNNGNIQVQGDFIQEGGQLNIASGGTNNTILRIQGDIYQSPGAVITETTGGNPFLELNGARMQDIAMAGRILNQVGFRLNNPFGARLRLPLLIPWKLDLVQGIVYSSSTELLVLDIGCSVATDSSRLSGSYVDGPFRKQGLFKEDHFIFPVGKDGNLRWLELKGATGNFTVEYMHQNPASIGTSLGTGIDHISKLEYWTILADGIIDDQAKIELSFVSDLSGGVTDPSFLNVAGFQSAVWENAGHTGITGDFLRGSVLSGNSDFTANYYTLASTVNLENPLPLTVLDLTVKRITGKTVFNWTMQSPEQADYFDLYEETGDQKITIARVKAAEYKTEYRWIDSNSLTTGNHYYRLRMVDSHGREYFGKTVLLKAENENTKISWLLSDVLGRRGQLMIQSDLAETWNYKFLSADGRLVDQGTIHLNEGKNYLSFHSAMQAAGIYIFRAFDAAGKIYSLVFRNN
jgi:hypothetical protein